MGIPKFDDIFKPYLEFLLDGQVHTTKEIREYIVNYFNLSADDISEMLPSGTQTKFDNRIGWSKTHLKHAGLINAVTRFSTEITERGKEEFQAHDEITVNVLKQFPEYLKFVGRNMRDETITTDTDSEEITSETPMETIQRMYEQLNKELEDEIITAVLEQSSAFFEHLTVKLLEKMGYCKDLKGKGITTKPTADGGIDGVIYQDRLGFDKIYIQAKRWESCNIGRPEIQKFFGAMAGHNAKKGVFITTSKFSDHAVEFANSTGIILVDGETLAKLMIEYELGVNTDYSFKIKKIDTDFFME